MRLAGHFQLGGAKNSAALRRAGHLPQPGGVVQAGAGQVAPVGAESQRADGLVVGQAGQLAGAGVRDAPHPGDGVVAAGGDQAPIRADGQAGDQVVVEQVGGALLAGVRVPHAHGQVAAGRDGIAALRVEGHRLDAHFVRYAAHPAGDGEGAQRLLHFDGRLHAQRLDPQQPGQHRVGAHAFQDSLGLGGQLARQGHLRLGFGAAALALGARLLGLGTGALGFGQRLLGLGAAALALGPQAFGIGGGCVDAHLGAAGVGGGQVGF